MYSGQALIKNNRSRGVTFEVDRQPPKNPDFYLLTKFYSFTLIFRCEAICSKTTIVLKQFEQRRSNLLNNLSLHHRRNNFGI